MCMTTEQVGAYTRLLCYQWEQGGIPPDKEMLSHIAGVPACKLTHVLAKFELHEDGLLKNARMEAERVKVESARDRQTHNGRKGGRPPKTPWQAKASPQAPAENPPSAAPSLSPEHPGENGTADGCNPSLDSKPTYPSLLGSVSPAEEPVVLQDHAVGSPTESGLPDTAPPLLGLPSMVSRHEPAASSSTHRRRGAWQPCFSHPPHRRRTLQTHRRFPSMPNTLPQTSRRMPRSPPSRQLGAEEDVVGRTMPTRRRHSRKVARSVL